MIQRVPGILILSFSFRLAMDKVVLGKRKRFSYDAAFKLKVIKYAEENGGNRAAGREFP